MKETEFIECGITGNIEEKKENLLLKDITDEKKISGIYSITNKINGMVYIGSSNDIKRDRWKEHRWSLRNNKHTNDHLQKSWNKYGENNFEFVVEEILPPERLKLVEQQYLNVIKSLPERRNRYYNISTDSTCPTRGIKHTEEYKKKMSELLKGKKKPPFSEEHKMNLSKSKIGNTYFKNRKFSKESIEKMSIVGKKKVGEKNPAFDKTIYHFRNLLTHEEFVGTRFDFYTKFGFENKSSQISRLVKGKRNHFRHWTVKFS